MAKRMNSRRIHAMDELRGLLVIGMIVHHALYTVGYLFGVPWAIAGFDWISQYLHPLGAALFVLLCGISCHLSRSNRKRGLRLAAFAVAMSVVLYFAMPSAMIWFGILHCLAACILLYALSARALNKVPALVVLVVSAALAVLFWPLQANHGYIGIDGLWTVAIPETLRETRWLMFTGLGAGFGADWFPLLPWLFVFLTGTALGRWAAQGKFPKGLYKDRFAGLSWVGRHAVWFYLAHQPIIYGVCWALFKWIL
ncbi:MAG: DUF1624 domain-containing protein [Clostridia bacterium]|nr:DUF1624 domain-containing protein [Clostridia bacterium]